MNASFANFRPLTMAIGNGLTGTVIVNTMLCVRYKVITDTYITCSWVKITWIQIVQNKRGKEANNGSNCTLVGTSI